MISEITKGQLLVLQVGRLKDKAKAQHYHISMAKRNNIWMALEDAVTQLSDSSAPINLTIWPELPEEKGGVCIYEGRLKDLRDNFQSSEHSRISFDAVVAA